MFRMGFRRGAALWSRVFGGWRQCFQLVLCYYALGCCIGAAARMPTTEEALQTYLLTNYSATARPVLNGADAVNVSMGLAVISLQKLDQRTSEAEFNVWLRHWWTDERLKWTPADWGGITQTSFPTNPEYDGNVWVPDILLYQSTGKPLDLLAPRSPSTTMGA